MPNQHTIEPGQRFNPYRMFVGLWIPNGIARNPDLSTGAKLCLGRLYQYAGEYGFAQPDQDALAKELGKGVRTVQGYVAELVEKGFLEVHRRGLGKSNRYWFTWHDSYMGEVSDVADPETPDPADAMSPGSAAPSSIPKESSSLGNTAVRNSSDLQPNQEPEATICRWIAETATARCRHPTAKERTFLNTADSPDLRERLEPALRDAADPLLTALRMAGYGRGLRKMSNFEQANEAGYYPKKPRFPQESTGYTAKPPKPVSAPEQRLRKYLEAKGCDFAGCGPSQEWIVNEVLQFQAQSPTYFAERFLPPAIKSADGIGSTVIANLYGVIHEMDKTTKRNYREDDDE